MTVVVGARQSSANRSTIGTPEAISVMTNGTSTVLIVEDDRQTRDLIARYLREHGFAVGAVTNGKEMDRHLSQNRVDLIVLDLMLPGEDGLSLCRRLRCESATPIIILTAKGEDLDRILGLEMGADDYLPKPFNPRELLARINAVLRRQSGPQAAAAAARHQGQHQAGLLRRAAVHPRAHAQHAVEAPHPSRQHLGILEIRAPDQRTVGEQQQVIAARPPFGRGALQHMSAARRAMRDIQGV